MKKGTLNKVDVRNFCNISGFEAAIRWAEQYNVTSEISENVTIIQKKKQEYIKEIDILGNRVQPTADEKFEAWKSAEGKKTFCKWLSIGAFAIFLICIYFMNLNSVSSHIVLGILIFLVFLLMVFVLLTGGIAAIVFKVISYISEKKYNSYICEVSCESKQIAERYEKDVNILQRKIDNLYLNSLEPAHREAVLMRRDQERQHQERMRIEREKLNSQKAMEEEQRRIRQAQEELLFIEQEREERYRKSRY